MPMKTSNWKTEFISPEKILRSFSTILLVVSHYLIDSSTIHFGAIFPVSNSYIIRLVAIFPVSNSSNIHLLAIFSVSNSSAIHLLDTFPKISWTKHFYLERRNMTRELAGNYFFYDIFLVLTIQFCVILLYPAKVSLFPDCRNLHLSYFLSI